MLSDLRDFVIRARRSRPRVLFVNDCGFLGGAGIAQRRQVQSLLTLGFDAKVLCWMEETGDHLRALRDEPYRGTWLGIEKRNDLNTHNGYSHKQLANELCEVILRNDPDLVIFGNLHWAGWPIEVISAVRLAGLPTITYLHDIHIVSGRCAYPGVCEQYTTGCGSDCPTHSEYPALPPNRIAAAWAARRDIFEGSNRVPLATNSTWTTRIAEMGFGGRADVRTVWLGVDTSLFKPFDKRIARRLLGLRQDEFIAICGAINLGEQRKGGPMLRSVISRLASQKGVTVVGFGHNSEHFEGIHGFGNINDERQMAVLFNAADIMINAAQEEAFGQTLMEAAACGLPVVATDVGGVRDVARPNENALLVPYGQVSEMLAAINLLKASVDKRVEMGIVSRKIASSDFSMQAQSQNWLRFLEDLFKRESLTGQNS